MKTKNRDQTSSLIAENLQAVDQPVGIPHSIRVVSNIIDTGIPLSSTTSKISNSLSPDRTSDLETYQVGKALQVLPAQSPQKVTLKISLRLLNFELILQPPLNRAAGVPQLAGSGLGW